MNTLILQAFARLPQTEPESNWLAYTILALSGFAAGFFLGRWIEQRRAYSRGYLEGFRNGSTAHEGDISCPPENPVIEEDATWTPWQQSILHALENNEKLTVLKVPPRAPTIKISPRNVPPKSPFTVSKEGQLAQDMGWQKGGKTIQ